MDMELMNTTITAMQTAMKAVDTIPDDNLKLALVCTMFDHVCETCGMDKAATLEKLRGLILQCNNELGNMYA